MNRTPITHQFTNIESMIFSKAYHKKQGQPVRGDSTMVVARHLESLGLVSIEAIKHGGAKNRRTDGKGGQNQGGILMKVTDAGREAWQNAGLIAAGRPPVCL